MLTPSSTDSAALVADWIELELSLGVASISRATLGGLLENASGLDPGEAFVSDVWRHLRRRIARYNTDFFELAGDLARRNDAVVNGRLAYEVYLIFSHFGAPMTEGSDPKLFERLSSEAVSNYIGGKSFVFGWPVLEDVQAVIAERVKQVCEKMNEAFVVGPGTQYKDRGVDHIAWKNFSEPDVDDHRTSQIVMLCQCAAGHNWPNKTRELPIGSWRQYVRWGTDPIVGFSVPCVIDDPEWHEIAREVEGIVFDRVRLLNLLPNGSADAGLNAELLAWRDEMIAQYRT